MTDCEKKYFSSIYFLPASWCENSEDAADCADLCPPDADPADINLAVSYLTPD